MIRTSGESAGIEITQKRRKIPDLGKGDTQTVTPVTEMAPLTSLRRAALTRAIDAARAEGRDVDANVLGEVLATLAAD